jgi:predicted esterase
MSVFKSKQLRPLAGAKGHRYYILHSPQDFIPMRMAEQARDILRQAGAQTKLATYTGGHGWRGDVYGMIRKGIEWLQQGRVDPVTEP